MSTIRSRVARLVLGCALVALATGCGGGGDDDDDGGFVVGERPASLEDGSENNLPPPDDMLVPVSAGRTMAPPKPMDLDEEDGFKEEALRLARLRLAVLGAAETDDVADPRLAQDEYGGVHVRFAQTYKGVPVIGGAMATHHPNDGGDHVSDGLIRGLDLDVEPGFDLPSAEAMALSEYAGPSGVVVIAKGRLAVLPLLGLVRNDGTRGEDHTEDFDVVLEGARLVYEVTVAPELPDLAAVAEAAIVAAPVDSPNDDDPTGARAAGATRAGNEAVDATFQKFTAAVTAPGVRFEFDALTGEVISKQVLLEHDDLENEEDTGYGYLNGLVPIDSAFYAPANKRILMDRTRPALVGSLGFGSVTLDAKNLETHSFLAMNFMTDGNGVWGDGVLTDTATSALTSTRRQTPAVDVHWSVGMTWDFFQNVFNRWGLDGEGGFQLAAVHYGDEYTDAHYNAASKFICFGDGDTNGKPGNYSLNTVGHELGHRFWHECGHDSKAGESSALNEGHGDIQGSLVTFYRTTQNGTGSLLRRLPNFIDWKSRLVDPAGYSEESDGSTYYGLSYWSSTLKDGPEHVGGLPFGRAMIYLAEGAPSDPDSTLWTTEFPDGLGGVGMGRAAQIWKTAITSYLVGTPSYAGMRTAFIDSAAYLFGNGSMEVKAVKRAFAAIRVGASVNDTLDPVITYAKVYDVNTEDMTALVYATATDDTGLRQMKVTGHDTSYFPTVDFLLGYHSMLRAPAGKPTVQLTVTDSDGKTKAVNRQVVKARDHSLLDNGDFEDGMTSWTSVEGKDQVGVTSTRSFIGDRYLVPEGTDTIYQNVTIPSEALTATLVFRILVRDSTKAGEHLRARVRTAGGILLETLEIYDIDTPTDGRNWLNKGYLRQEFDLSDYIGDAIRISFETDLADDVRRFALDQVVLTYTEEVVVGPPVATVRAYEDTVSFQCPEIEGVSNAEIGHVDYWVDGQLATFSTNSSYDWYATHYLSSFGPGPHWVGVIVRAPDNTVIGQSVGVWFAAPPIHELLVNRGFESGAWDLTYSGVPPKVLVVEDVLDSTISFQGDRALRLGAQGTAHVSQAGQVVHVPHQLKTLDFSARIRVVSDEVFMGPGPDTLKLEIWDANTYQKLSEHLVADSSSRFDIPGLEELWGTYWRAKVSLTPGLYAGKDVIVILKVTEDASLETSFYVDNTSLRYTQLGLNLGG